MLGVSIFQPLLQERLELAHVLKGQIKSLKSGDGSLGEVVAIHLAHCQANISLGVAQLDSLLLEQLRKPLQLFQVSVLIRRKVQPGRQRMTGCVVEALIVRGRHPRWGGQHCLGRPRRRGQPLREGGDGRKSLRSHWRVLQAGMLGCDRLKL